MKTLLIISSLLLLASCGKAVTSSTGETVCRTREEMRAMCYVEEMVKFNHDANLDQWVKNYCANIYKNESCYTSSFQ